MEQIRKIWRQWQRIQTCMGIYYGALQVWERREMLETCMRRLAGAGMRVRTGKLGRAGKPGRRRRP